MRFDSIPEELAEEEGDEDELDQEVSCSVSTAFCCGSVLYSIAVAL